MPGVGPGTVVPVNDAPAAVDDSLSAVAEDSGVRVISFASLIGNDTMGPANEAGQSLTITGVTNVVGGTASIVGTDIRFTPASDFSGAASFDYTVRDNGQTRGADDFKSDVGSVSFAVTPVNDAPVINPLDKTVAGAITERFTLTGSTQLDQTSGTIRFSDIDSADRPVASIGTQTVTAFFSNGTTPIALTAAQETALKAAFTIAPQAGNTSSGTINWSYSIADRTLDFLPRAPRRGSPVK